MIVVVDPLLSLKLDHWSSTLEQSLQGNIITYTKDQITLFRHWSMLMVVLPEVTSSPQSCHPSPWASAEGGEALVLLLPTLSVVECMTGPDTGLTKWGRLLEPFSSEHLPKCQSQSDPKLVHCTTFPRIRVYLFHISPLYNILISVIMMINSLQ